MPRKPLSESEKNQVRLKARNAALGIIKEKGVGALTIRSVAREINMSAMSLYTYFENKSDLMAYVQSDLLKDFAENQAKAAENAKGAEAALRALAMDFERFAQESPADFEICFRFEDEGKALPQMVHEHFNQAIAPLAATVEELTKARRLHGDAYESTKTIWAAWYGYAKLTHAGILPADGRPDIETMALKGTLDTASPARAKRGDDWVAVPAN